MENHQKVDVTFPVGSVWKEWGFRESVIWGCSGVNAGKRLTDSNALPAALLSQFISKGKMGNSSVSKGLLFWLSGSLLRSLG